jgi:hypothetical protein
MRRKVLINKLSAVGWAALGLVSFLLGWQNSVALVWLASVYANVKTDWGTAEAADDRAVVVRLERIERQAKAGRRRGYVPRRLR